MNQEIDILPEIEKAVYLSPHEYLIACDSNGHMVVWAKGENVFETKYETKTLTNKMDKFPVSCIAYNSE